MLSNKKYIVIYLVIVLLIVCNEFIQSSTRAYEKPQKPIFNLDEKSLLTYQEKYDINKSLNSYWNITTPKIAKIKSIDTKSPKIKKEENKNILCISSSCYRLIGIYQEKNIHLVTLYNKDKNESLKDYTTDAILDLKVKITNITTNTVEFTQLNSSKQWYFKIFDINQTKYKPKDIKK